MGSIPGSGRSPGEGNGHPFQYPCLGNPKDRGAWWATVHGVAKSWTWLSTPHHCLWYFVVTTQSDYHNSEHLLSIYSVPRHGS